MKLSLKAPQPLTVEHLTDDFSCGEISLDAWLKRRARINQSAGASRTFVMTDPSNRVFGYYALAAGAVSRQIATGEVRRNMPEPIPVLVLARLAVDTRVQGMKLGAALLKDAVARTEAVSLNAVIRALLVHALHDRAKQFYEYYGFRESPQHPLMLMLRLHPAT